MRKMKLGFINVFLMIFLGNNSCSQQVEKPNIVFILVDDLGYHDLGYSGSKYYETPFVDKLATESMAFAQGYSASRVCSPSRASIMTGKFTARHGITDWIGAKTGTAWRTKKRFNKLLPAEYVKELPQQDITLSETLKANGYTTFFAGKWHLGGEGSFPEDHGFDHNIGGIDAGSPPGGFFSPWQNPKLENKKSGENLTLRLANETANFIKTNKDSTFFTFLSFYAVHAPLQTTAEKWKKYRDKADRDIPKEKGYEMERILPERKVQDNPIYAGMIETMDTAVGIVLNALKENGLDENTIVVFTSDNGGVTSGDHYATSNLPLRGGKGYQWEGGTRVPMLIKVPWLDCAQKTSNVAVTGTDIYPTLLDLANIPLNPNQHQDGLSLKPLLENKPFNSSRPLYWHYPHYGNQGGEPASIVQFNQWKLIHYWEDNRQELYRLPSEETDDLNVIKTYPKIAEELYVQLSTWLNQVDAKYPTKDPIYDEALATKNHLHTVKTKLPSLEENRKKMLSKDFKPNETWWKSQPKQ